MGGRIGGAFRVGSALVLAAVLVAGATFYFQPLWVNDEIIRYHLWHEHVQSRYVEIDGSRIHFFEALPPGSEGKPPGDEGKPLVLIHGLGSRGEDWSPMIPALAAAGFHVYAPDLLGYGRSGKPDVDYSITLEETMVREFMDSQGIEGADVAGWSMGGWVALKLTADHPEMVDHLVVYDSVGIYFPPTFEASLFLPADSMGLAKLQAMLTPKPRPLPAFVSRAAVRRLQQSGWVIERSVASMESGKDLLDFRLHEIERPTLIVWGEKDDLVPLPVGQAMHRKIAGSSLLVIGGCGHLAPGECARPVLKGTIEFLKAEPPLPRGGERMVDGAIP
jgi:pimeloyl-ACP methyl ester carboxylesterase